MRRWARRWWEEEVEGGEEVEPYGREGGGRVGACLGGSGRG